LCAFGWSQALPDALLSTSSDQPARAAAAPQLSLFKLKGPTRLLTKLKSISLGHNQAQHAFTPTATTA
jgi:hypothetical protein